MINRNIEPEIKDIDQINIPNIIQHILPNGIPCYHLDMCEQDVSRIDFMIEAGKWSQPKKLVATFTNLLLKEGAGALDSKTIAEQLDFYGAWLQLSETHHYSYITLYTPNKYFRETLDILELMIKGPTFPEPEFQTYLDRKKQSFLIDREKVQVLALENFSNSLFGNHHPYGRMLSPEDFDQLQVSDLKSFHKELYHSGNTKIILAGKVSDDMLQLVESKFGKEEWGKVHDLIHTNFPIEPAKEKIIFIEKNDAMQNGIRMGMQSINRSHRDFNALRVTNTILGGYFGSRLMSNIREDKGYTYGISSSITTLKEAAYLTIATQTACEYSQSVVKEVFYEIERLHQDLVGEEELKMVKSYMIGDLVRNLDGVFSMADIYISLLAGNLPFDYYEHQINAIKNITSQEIRNMAQEYLKKDEMYCIIAGSQSKS